MIIIPIANTPDNSFQSATYTDSLPNIIASVFR